MAWINLRPTEKSLAALASRLLETLGSCGLKKLPAHPPAVTPDGAYDCLPFVAALMSSVANHRRRVLLVLDDYHAIEHGTSDELLGRIFEQMPPNLTIALASRHACPIPLSRVLLQRRLQRIDKRALLFSKAETRQFFGRSLSPAQVTHLYWLTEGWPAALEMARVCLPEWQKTQPDNHNTSEFSRLINEYCATEVLRYTEPRAVELLIECSVTETLEPGLCNAVRQQDDSGRILAHLMAQESFAEPIDLEKNVCRIPLLLRRALMRRAAERGSEFVARAHLRAAAHFEAIGETLPALRHYLSAREPAAAAAALERATPLVIIITQGDSRGQELLDLIPGSQLHHFPRLALCRAYLDFKRGLMDEARTLLAALSARTENFTVDRAGGNAAQLKAESMCVELIMEFYGRSRAPLEYLRTLEQQMSAVGEGDIRLVMMFHLVFGLLYELRGDFEGAQTHLIQCEKLNAREPAPWSMMWVKYHEGTIALARGQLTEARYLLQAGLKAWSAEFRSYSPYRAVTQLALAEIDYEMDGLTGAQTRLAEALYTAEHVEGWFEPYAAVYEMSMMMHWHAAQLDRVEVLLARSVAIQRVGVLLESFLHALRLRFELLQGRLEAAQSIVDTRGLDSRWAAPTFQEEFSYREWDLIGLCLCLLAIHKRDFATAARVVERLDQIARLGGRGRTIAKAQMLRAIIAHQQGEEDQAVAHLLGALEAGHAQGYRRVFLDEGELVAPVLAAVERRAAALPVHLALYARTLSNALLKRVKDPGGDRTSTLSEREHEVLRELGHGYSNKLIARKLGLSTPTINFHVRNVFQKLGVHKRAAATAEAHRRGWLS
ncbi:MAG: LuxR C-terminal-related transcriptional regulator [Gammaproteobacteria bacterium]